MVDLTDWRQSLVETVKEGPMKGALVTKVIEEPYSNKKNLLSFPQPCPIALFLDLSYCHQNKAEMLAQTLLEKIEKYKEGPQYLYNFSAEHIKELYDYFEHIFASITLAYNALESFANIEIGEKLPDNYQRKITKANSQIPRKKEKLVFLELSEKLISV